jgi:integrase
VRTPRTLPRILEPVQVQALLAALRTWRDRAMAEAMVLGGLRRCEVLGLRWGDLQVAARRVFIAEGKGGHQRLIPLSGRFFTSVASYLDTERPAEAGTDRLFVVVKGPRRGQPLSAAGLDQILDSARTRAGLARATCHQLRHTCLTRLQMGGIASGASFDGTRDCLPLSDLPLGSRRRPTGRAWRKRWPVYEGQRLLHQKEQCCSHS